MEYECDFIVEYKYLFLKNISSYSELKKINIENIDDYYSFFDRLIELFTAFESALDGVEETLEFKDFFETELDNVYCTVEELKEDIDNIVVKRNLLVKVDFADKIITFTYSSLIQFEETNKIEGVPMSKNFMKNIEGIMNNKTHIDHSHVNAGIIGYSYSYCNQKVRENKSKINVIAHNLFRFDFFFLLKGYVLLFGEQKIFQ